MTEKQQQIYDFIVGFIKDNLYPPTIQEIGEGVGLTSKSSIFNHLLAIQKKGYIEVKNNSPRAIKVKGYKFIKA